MSEPTNATDAVQLAFDRQCERVRNRIAGEYGPYTNADWADANTMYREYHALLARVEALKVENADLWTELNLCRQMCRDSQPARLPGDHHGT